MDIEKRNKKLRKQLGEVGYEDLDLNNLYMDLQLLYTNASKDSINELPELKSIYIVGSFADNNAIKSASDIDILFVSNKKPTEEQKSWLSDYVLYNWSGYVSTQNLFGFVDANLSSNKPFEPYINIDKHI